MSLDEPTPSSDPFALFAAWFRAFAETNPRHPDAMMLATASRDGAPSVRAVLLKGVEQGAFRFFSNYESRKGRELAENPRAALLFFWSELGRQVRVEGDVSRLSAAEADAYFATRPRASQLSAHVSPQSRVLARAELEALRDDAERRFAGAPIPRPESWGGYALVPRAFEFWIADPARLHHRFRYQRTDEAWDYSELAP